MDLENEGRTERGREERGRVSSMRITFHLVENLFQGMETSANDARPD